MSNQARVIYFFDLNNKYLKKGLVSQKPGEPSLPFPRVFPRLWELGALQPRAQASLLGMGDPFSPPLPKLPS